MGGVAGIILTSLSHAATFLSVCIWLADACPYPDNFAIICRTENLLNQTNFFPCGPNGKPASVSQYCTAYPPGSQLGLFQPSDIRAALTTEGINGILLPPEITCPAGANSTTVKYPVIVSFNGRTDCLCRVGGGASCWFVSGPAGATEYSGGTAASRLIDTSISLTIPGAVRLTLAWCGCTAIHLQA